MRISDLVELLRLIPLTLISVAAVLIIIKMGRD